ncbi:MAG: peroxidase-related enzyme [Magnetococcales bacterium]|nr:peroxidase-related enzyme [Magnetococcales bacterium]MBF0114955.1 peroxidase-related enzyme [Magnetococcales bacterium]
MERINRLENEHHPAESEAVLREIEAGFGMRPALFLTYAHHPHLLRANWEKAKVLMMGGFLSRKTKETIALVTSRDNACTYCIGAHTAALKSIGVSDAEIQCLESNLSAADFSDKERVLISLARKAATSPRAVTDADLDSARVHGASNGEIVEALGVMELFAGFNRFADALDIALDLGSV